MDKTDGDLTEAIAAYLRYHHWIYAQYLRGYCASDNAEAHPDDVAQTEGLAAFALGRCDYDAKSSPRLAREVVAKAKEMCEK